MTLFPSEGRWILYTAIAVVGAIMFDIMVAAENANALPNCQDEPKTLKDLEKYGLFLDNVSVNDDGTISGFKTDFSHALSAAPEPCIEVDNVTGVIILRD